MKILAFDTSSSILSVALWENGKVLGETESDGTARHSNTLVSFIDKTLGGCRVNPKDLDYIAVGLGPGSFTGLRVGVTVAKLLGYTLNKKIVGVSGLEALAREAANPQGETVAVMMDARRSMVYSAIYDLRKDAMKTIQKPSLLPLESFRRKLRPKFRLIEHDTQNGFFYPKARWIAESAVLLIKNKKFIDPFRLEPLYLYPRDCNVTRKK